MANKYDLTKLENLVVGESENLVNLSPEAVQLCIMALQDRAIYRGAWVDDDETITPARWDVAGNFVNRAKAELMAPVTEIDGGNA